jgi:hypothetical protein
MDSLAVFAPLLTPLLTMLSSVVAVVWTVGGIKADALQAKQAAEAGTAELRRVRQELRKLADRVLILETKVQMGGQVVTTLEHSA